MPALRHRRPHVYSVAGPAKPGEQMVGVLLGLKHQPLQRLNHPRRRLQDPRDGVATKAGQNNSLDLARSQDLQSLALPALQVGKGCPQPGVRAGPSLRCDHMEAACPQMPSQLAVAGAHVRHRYGGLGHRPSHRSEARRHPATAGRAA